jgi:hypothetical protein
MNKAVKTGIVQQVVPIAGLSSKIVTAGTALIVAGGDAIDGYIINPSTVADQGIPILNVLYVDPTGPAANTTTNTTVAIQPGGRYDFPPNVGLGIWANSNASGHKFTAVQIVPLSLLPPTQASLDAAYIKGTFPPTGPTGLLKPIQSYLYQEYSDDSDLQAFVSAYNSMQQDITDTYNGLNLPVYTSDSINGALLDWVGQGIYGLPRPSLTTGRYSLYGPYNTAQYNSIQYNDYEIVIPDQPAFTNDDVYKRILTWHVSKREMRYFNIEWLKKRIMKFLFGINGSQPIIDNTYQISITFGPNYEVTIRFITGNRTFTGGAVYNANNFQYNAIQYDDFHSTYVNLVPLPNVDIFQEAVASGVLELPFQFHFDVVIG